MFKLFGKEWLTLKEASEYSSLSSQAIHNRIKRGHLPKRLYNNRLVFLKDELDRSKTAMSSRGRLDFELQEMYGKGAMTVAKAAKFSQMSPQLLRKKISEKEIPTQQYGHIHVIMQRDLENYIKRCLKLI